MKHFFGEFVSGRGALGLLLARLVFGSAIAIHGWQKVMGPGGPTGWMDPESAVPPQLQGLATLAELGGGLALLMGLLTPLAALGIACTMLVAIATTIERGATFVSAGQGQPAYELAALHLAFSLVMLLTGPGAFSLDRLLFGRGQSHRSVR